ncbi:MAG: MFS transporter [Alphaproteobacteria bacterium]|nr:MFS transporter [Alphaproteobacteria bacterium]MDE1967613.1 MFS transporter [Alphaproteobacteria bacterium]
MKAPARAAAVWLAGFCSFLDLYAPQSILPMIRDLYGVDAVVASHMISSTTVAVAIIAPFTGAGADLIGRKRVIVTAMVALIVPTVMIALSTTLPAMVFWRFVQGLLLPPIFVVTVAYIGDEVPIAEATGVAGIYLSGSCFGGFFGRFLCGILVEPYGIRGAFLGLAALTAVAAVGVMALMPRERQFVPSAGPAHALRHILAHVFDPQLDAIFAVGFGVLFSFVATFTYVNFHLAAPPFDLSAAALGTIFLVYLVGVTTTPLAGRLVRRFGRRRLVLGVLGIWICGLLLTLTGSLWVIVAGLAVGAGCGFIVQTAATASVAVSAQRARSSAVGLYVTCYYVGGSIGAVLPGYAWNRAGWPGCVAIVIAMLVLLAAIVLRFWRERPAQARPER